MKLGWIYDRRFLLHETSLTHVERPERLEVIAATVEQAGLAKHLEAIDFRHASPVELALVHQPAYVDLVRLACEEGFTFIGSQDTEICRWSYDIAALASGAALAACDAVMRGRVQRVFCAVRPPGHHAEVDQAMGFCLFNHVAIAAEHLIRNHGLTRIAIVDLDVHHGNGTQHIFETRKDVFYISLHERPESLHFPGTGHADETGIGDGMGFTLNVPLSRGSGEREFRRAIQQKVVPALDDFGPQFLLVSAGFDGLMWDGVANLSLEPESYARLTEPLVSIAERHAGGRLVSLLEGGYDLSNLGAAVTAHLRALMTAPSD